MGDVTISETHYLKLKENEAKQRAEHKLAREEAELSGISAWKAGRKTEGLMMMGGANMPAMKAVLAGAGIYYVATGDWFDKIKLFQENWWLKPLMIIGLGYWLFRRQSPWAAALLSAGAAMFMQAFKARPQKKEDGKDTRGVDEDAGRWDWSEDTYGARGRWVETPTGARTFMREGAGAPGERIAERVFEHARAV